MAKPGGGEKAPNPMPTNTNPIMASRAAGAPPPVMQKPNVATPRPSLASTMAGAPRSAAGMPPGAGQPGVDPRMALQMLRRQ